MTDEDISLLDKKRKEGDFDDKVKLKAKDGSVFPHQKLPVVSSMDYLTQN